MTTQLLLEALAVDPDTLVNQHNVADDLFTLASGDQGVLKHTSSGHVSNCCRSRHAGEPAQCG